MKKFFVAAALIVGIFVAPSQAEAVRLCDYTLGDFIGRYNIVADGMNFPRSVRINSAPHYASSINYKGYTAYDISLGDSQRARRHFSAFHRPTRRRGGTQLDSRL